LAEPSLSFVSRLALAFAAFFRILGDAVFAARVAAARDAAPALPPPEPELRLSAPAIPKAAPPPRLREAPTDAALQLLALLQREGRFVDFVKEDVSSFSDAEIGAAARVVHDGCARALDEHMHLSAVRSEPEESRVTLEAHFATEGVRVTGNVRGEPPFTGTLRHRGWRASDVHLPQLTEGHDVTVIAPAEVEL
jgi:hypothetical protein